MVAFSHGRVLEIDAWAGEEAIIAYSIINNLTIRIFRPDGTWNTIVEGDTEIELYFLDNVHYKPIIETTPQKKVQMRDHKYHKVPQRRRKFERRIMHDSGSAPRRSQRHKIYFCTLNFRKKSNKFSVILSAL
jgi:hypothetical protein